MSSNSVTPDFSQNLERAVIAVHAPRVIEVEEEVVEVGEEGAEEDEGAEEAEGAKTVESGEGEGS